MRIIVNAQAEWNFWAALYPIFKQALPHIDRLSKDDQQNLRIKNDITTIRHNFNSIPLQLQQAQLNQDLKQDDFDSFLKSLLSVLDIFEDLVEEEVHQLGRNARPSIPLQQEISLKSRYPKLTILKYWLQTSGLEVEACDFEPRESKGLHLEANYSTDLLLEVARHIKFHRRKDRTPKHKTPDYSLIANEIYRFNTFIGQIFRASLEASDGDLGNTVLLRDDEIEFIRRAHRLNLLSRSFFTFLANSITCCKTHSAIIHLSGFLDPKINFDLLVAAQAEQYWHFNCKWVYDRPSICNPAIHNLCFRPEGFGADLSLQLAFNDEGIWDNACHGIPTESIPVPDQFPTLCDLVLSGSSVPTFDNDEFEPLDHKIVELLLTCSLFHLNTNHCLHDSWDIKSILMYPETKTQDPLKRWRPHIICSLKSSLDNIRCEDNDDILSFGLLIMEMEAKQKVLPTENDSDWVTGLPSKDSMLKRVLTDWKRKLEDGYQQIGKACLQFRELVDKLHEPSLTQDMKRTAVIYKYILAPLHQLIAQRYCSASLLSSGFPEPSQSSSSPHARQAGQNWGSDLILFDDSNFNPTWHNPQKVSWASEFLRNIKPFVDKIRDLEDNCKPIPDWANWRQEKIRIAIIDTGIDEDDIMIESALECGRIKNCRGFLSNEDDYRDVYGHGTHVARLLLDTAPSAELYIAKVSDGKTINVANLSRISEAIKWAHETCKAHIISMSFGIESDYRNIDIDKAISNAAKYNTSIFAAAANSGGNKPRAYPSNKRNRVICIHASDGKGNDGKISPSPEQKEENFSTLGISIESKWKGDKAHISGTSFATPIAVALAANVLEFARYKCLLSEYEQECLYSFSGVSAILRLMSTDRQGYDYITPLHLWDSKKADEDIAKEITDIARSS